MCSVPLVLWTKLLAMIHTHRTVGAVRIGISLLEDGSVMEIFEQIVAGVRALVQRRSSLVLCRTARAIKYNKAVKRARCTS